MGESQGRLSRGGLELAIDQEYSASPDRSKGFFGRYTLTNQGLAAEAFAMSVQSDVLLKPAYNDEEWRQRRNPRCGEGTAAYLHAHDVLGSILLAGDMDWNVAAEASTLSLTKSVILLPGESRDFTFWFGLVDDLKSPAVYEALRLFNPAGVRTQWANRLSRVAVDTEDTWVREECVWTAGQLLAFENYDNSVDEYYISLGGYGFFTNPNEPNGYNGFGAREVSETALPLAYWEPELAESSLRWTAKIQLSSGDVPNGHNFRSDHNMHTAHTESDNEIWFVLACCEYIETTGNTASSIRLSLTGIGKNLTPSGII